MWIYKALWLLVLLSSRHFFSVVYNRITAKPKKVILTIDRNIFSEDIDSLEKLSKNFIFLRSRSSLFAAVYYHVIPEEMRCQKYIDHDRIIWDPEYWILKKDIKLSFEKLRDSWYVKYVLTANVDYWQDLVTKDVLRDIEGMYFGVLAKETISCDYDKTKFLNEKRLSVVDFVLTYSAVQEFCYNQIASRQATTVTRVGCPRISYSASDRMGNVENTKDYLVFTSNGYAYNESSDFYWRFMESLLRRLISSELLGPTDSVILKCKNEGDAHRHRKWLLDFEDGNPVQRVLVRHDPLSVMDLNSVKAFFGFGTISMIQVLLYDKLWFWLDALGGSRLDKEKSFYGVNELLASCPRSFSIDTIQAIGNIDASVSQKNSVDRAARLRCIESHFGIFQLSNFAAALEAYK